MTWLSSPSTLRFDNSPRYQIGRRIGSGGMGNVFEGVMHGIEGFTRRVAIKRMQPELAADPIYTSLFIHEARVAAQLDHDNIVDVFDFDRDDGTYFLVMELLQGVDLRRLSAVGPLPPGLVAYIAAKVLDALGYAHELEHEGRPLGFVHRDVSPHNVMVTWHGAVKLLDFGVARSGGVSGDAHPGATTGKPAYMALEQMLAYDDLDGRADIFSLGVIMHELITGQRLFRGDSLQEIAVQLIYRPIPSLRSVDRSVPADFEDVVMTMLRRDRSQRFPTARAALDALLATSVIDPRALLQLRRMLQERFGAAVMASRAGVQPSAVTMSTALSSPSLATVAGGCA